MSRTAHFLFALNHEKIGRRRGVYYTEDGAGVFSPVKAGKIF